ncbi:DsrE family protein [Sulfurovum sp. zt1-1]|uniref:DsrE family protein n=1 Tax=Sulfurovum zhangzhouensis TaxID=3019067 RepID=A0ABT7QYR8_9BACT|nr:DsrE family protein [Sulfurovum zhangzhouensis]MDM5271659.1 DsrE family protein [Sulfurovum zhangzhouensis]
MKFFRALLLSAVSIIAVEANEYKAVFDCSSGNSAYIKSRMWLVGKTMDMIEEGGNTTSVVLTLHGKCVPMVSKTFDEVVDDKDIANTKEAQKWLVELAKRKNVKVIACSMSLQSNDIDTDDVLPFVTISDNSFVETIKYQNEGYALMTFK